MKRLLGQISHFIGIGTLDENRPEITDPAADAPDFLRGPGIRCEQHRIGRRSTINPTVGTL